MLMWPEGGPEGGGGCDGAVVATGNDGDGGVIPHSRCTILYSRVFTSFYNVFMEFVITEWKPAYSKGLVDEQEFQ